MKIVTWNVNSVRPRLQHLLDFLKENAPDIVLLQETKIINEAFPVMEIEELGYNIALHGQKTYNGVAIVSKFPLSDAITHLPGDDSDEQARYIEAVATLPHGALRVASVYVPNGQEVGSEKFMYKLAFLDRLHSHFTSLLHYNEMFVAGGDYNVAPFAADVYAPTELEGSIGYHPHEREKFRRLLTAGMYDAYRTLHPDTQQFSWWDYRDGGRSLNKGMRIDHVLVSPQALDRLTKCTIEDYWRDREKPSDHAPVTASFLRA